MKSTLLALVLVPFAAAPAPSPVLSGLYSVGDMGLVEFSVAEGRIVGTAKSSMRCGIELNEEVVSGTFEGDVFLGNVTICQSGPTCTAKRSYPMLGLWRQDVVVGAIRLDSGCHSTAIGAGRSLIFRPAASDERQRVGTDVLRSGQKPGEQAAQAIAEGEALILSQDYTLARERFRQAMALDEARWEAFLGYGLAEVKLGRPGRSLEYFDKALTIAQARRAAPASFAQIHLKTACAEVALGDKKRALASLKAALRVGGASPGIVAGLVEDPDLAPLRREPDFKRLVGEARNQQARKKPK